MTVPRRVRCRATIDTGGGAADRRPPAILGAMDTYAADRDARLPEIDWAAPPAGAVRDRVAVPSGSLARTSMEPATEPEQHGPRAPRVLLVPGATGSKEDFALMMPLLASAGFRVEAIDLAGQYESASAGPERLDPPATRYTMDLFVGDVLAVIDAGPAPVHLLGYSFGGTVAATAAARRPELVATLTLLSTPPTVGRSFGGIKRVGWLAGTAGPRTSSTVMLQGIRWNLTRVNKARQAFVRARLRRTRTSSVRDIMRLMSAAPDIATPLKGAGIPALVAFGTGDLWPAAQHRALAAALGAHAAAYRTGHSPCETTPHQLVADMLRLFERADPGG